MTPRTPQCKLFWPSTWDLNFQESRRTPSSQLLGVWASPSHLAQSGVATFNMPLYPWSTTSQGTRPNFFFFYCFHLWIRNWVHQGVWGCVILVSYIFSNFITLLIKTLTGVLPFSFPPTIGTMYFVDVNGCNPYTNWYGVYLVAILYVIMYENNIVNKCSSQYVLFLLINLVNNVPSTLLVDLTYPFPWGE